MEPGDDTRGRGRPRSADRDAQIRDAAWTIIARVGCAALTFEAIAQEIGCSRSTLYRRFASKADLIGNLLDETARSLAPIFSEDAAPRDKLLGYATTCATMYRGERGAAVIHIIAASRGDATIAQAVRGHSALVEAHYFEPLSALAPGASERNIRFALHTLVGSVLHHVATRQDSPSAREIANLVDAAVQLAAMPEA